MQQKVFNVIFVVFSCSLVLVQSSGRCTNTTIDIDISFSGSSHDKIVACDSLCQYNAKKNGTGLYCYHNTRIICPEVTVNGNEAVSCISSSMCRCNIIRCDVCSPTTVLPSTSLPGKSTSENVSTTKKILSIVVGKPATTAPGRNVSSNDTNITPSRTTLLHLQTIPMNISTELYHTIPNTTDTTSPAKYEYIKTTASTGRSTQLSNTSVVSISRTTHLPNTSTVSTHKTTHLLNTSNVSINRTTHLPNTSTVSTNKTTHLPNTSTVSINRTTHLPNTSTVSINRTTHLPNTSTVSISRTTHLPNTSTVSINRTTHLPNTSTVSISRTTHLPNTSTASTNKTTQLPNTRMSTDSINKTTQLPNTSAVLISRTPKLAITSTVLAFTSLLSTNTINIPITGKTEITSTDGQQRTQYTSEHIQKVESTTAELKPMHMSVLVSLVIITVMLC